MFIQDNQLKRHRENMLIHLTYQPLPVDPMSISDDHHVCSIDGICAREDEIEADSFRTAQRAREDDLQRK